MQGSTTALLFKIEFIGNLGYNLLESNSVIKENKSKYSNKLNIFIPFLPQQKAYLYSHLLS